MDNNKNVHTLQQNNWLNLKQTKEKPKPKQNKNNILRSSSWKNKFCEANIGIVLMNGVWSVNLPRCDQWHNYNRTEWVTWERLREKIWTGKLGVKLLSFKHK